MGVFCQLAFLTFSGQVHRRAVGQVSAVGQVHAKDGVAGLQKGEIDRHVGLCALISTKCMQTSHFGAVSSIL